MILDKDEKKKFSYLFLFESVEPLRGAKLQMTCSQRQYQELDNPSNHYLIG